MNSGIRFLQSGNDFPLTVSLGEKVPAWGLSRWNGNLQNGDGLRFLPPDDEGFTLRRDKQRGTGDSLVYKGRRRSHRFTILGDTAFEYDCILERETESNVITLLMDGAERFDFLRQPDFVKDPFLKGSYAVYKKETFIGEGTGKLCHIHRPQIIDSRGRRCWGDLSVAGNELRITIPEAWLSEAKYPIIVDPTIGTTTVGSQTVWEQEPGDWVPLINEAGIPVNRFLVNQTIDGLCTAFFYVYSDEEPESGGYPVLYSDNNNTPLTRRSTGESYIDLQVKSGKPAGWRSGTMRSNGSIGAGNYIWFGISTEYFWYARFDYGAKCYRDDNSGDPLPAAYPLLGAAYYDDFKLSMYFSYASAQNYVRTLTQGVTLTDSRKVSGAYKRNTIQTVRGTTALLRLATFPRQCLETVYNVVTMKGLPTLVRTILEHVRGKTDLFNGRGFFRNCSDTTGAGTKINSSRGFYRKAQDKAGGTDTMAFPVLFLRSLPEAVGLTDNQTQWAAYIRGLRIEAASRAETRHGGEYYRKQTDTVQAAGIPLRSLLIFVRLLTTAFIRDFLIRRFLKSNEELVLKSPVCRELHLDSRIA